MRPLSQRLTHRELLQRGDLTLCWRARDSVLDRPVFVKVLNPALAQDEEIRARFEREAKAVARLDHPNLVRIYEYGEDPEEGMYMLLEWIEGTTLAAQIAKGKRFGGEDFMRLARELLSGLTALHSVGILHRDLKPENILARQIPAGPGEQSYRDQYKITDFSLAALRDAPRLTHHEAIVGTPAYMAPEQASGGQPTERSDLFSAGIVLYEAATGHNPMIGETMLDTMRKVRESDVSFEHSAILNLPQSGQSLLHELLRKSSDQRPASANDALGLLHGRIEKGHESSRPRNFRFALMAIIVLAVGVVLIINVKKPQPRPEYYAKRDSVVQDPSPAKLKSDSQSVPEFRNPARDTSVVPQILPSPKKSVAEHVSPAVPTPIIVATDTGMMMPDSVDVSISTEPWAHIFIKGKQVGTTPLSAPLRLARGDYDVVLRNPAFPPIDLPIDAAKSATVNVILAQHVARIGARVEPWGEIFIDGESFGITPLTRPLYVSPGRHSIKITHPSLGNLHREIDASAGQVYDIEANMNTGSLLVATDAEGGR